MNVSRQRVETLFHEALQHAPEERETFLASACGSDHELRAELSSLLAHFESANATLEQPLVSPEFLSLLQSPARESLLGTGEILAGRFRILRFLASGGMGDVYEAEDTQLGGVVALKTIRTDLAREPRMLARFKNEIQLAKLISHPNVCRIHDLGIHQDERSTIVFLTMELLAGRTLAELICERRLTLAEVESIAVQIAAGLDAAHHAGVVHRDLKSRNVFVTGDLTNPRVVIADFGLAHAIQNEEPAAALTRTGEILGTLDYMAPEQLRGEPTGPFTDVYAFGLLLFEMVTGRKAFVAETPLQAAVKRLHDPAPSARAHAPNLSWQWDSAIKRCLNPDPAGRFQNAGDVVWFLEENRRSKSGRLLARFKSRRSLVTIGVIVLASLAALLAIIRYRQVRTDALRPPSVATPSHLPETAKMHYERGQYFWNLRTQEAFQKAIEEYQQAVAVNPQFAPPYSGLAWVYAMQSGFIAPTLILPKAKRYAEEAIRLDGRLAQGHAALAFVKFYYDWDWKGAESEFKTAIALDPNYASAHSNYAILLAVKNRFREAEAQAKLAEQADPVSAAVATGLGRIYSWSGDDHRAIDKFEGVIAMHPQFLESRLSLASALERTGDLQGAMRQISFALSESLNSSALADLGYLYAKTGDAQLARSMLLKIERLRSEKKRYISPCYPAIVHAWLGERDEAFRMLTEGLRERTFEMVYLKLNREYSPLWQDRRWTALIHSVGLAD